VDARTAESPKHKLGALVTEGKTKRIHRIAGNPDLVTVMSKDDITAGDGAKHDVIPGKGDSSVRIEVQTMDNNETIAQLSLRVPNKLGTVEFLEIDDSDRFYVLGENVPDSGRQSSTFVARYASNGKLEGIYELPLENTPLTRRFVTISGDGDVYFLRTKADNVEVVGVGFRSLRNASVIDLRQPRTPAKNLLEGKFDGKFDAIAAVRPMAVMSSSACSSSSVRRLRHASSTARQVSRKLGMPPRDCFGK